MKSSFPPIGSRFGQWLPRTGVLMVIGMFTLGVVVVWWSTTPGSSNASNLANAPILPVGTQKSALSSQTRPAESSVETFNRPQTSEPEQAAIFMPSKSEEPPETTAVALANSDLKKAIDWATRIQDPDLRQRAMIAVSNEAIRKDPVAAMDLIVGLPSSTQRNDLICRGASEWALSDPTKASKWANQIEDETLRADVVARIATSWGDSDPVNAANLVLDKLPEGRLQSDTLVSIVQRWGQANPEAAAAWVEQFPEGALKIAAIKNLAAVWSVHDEGKASQWLARATKAP